MPSVTSYVALHLERATPVGHYPAGARRPVFLANDRIHSMSASNGERCQNRELIRVQIISKGAEDIQL